MDVIIIGGGVIGCTIAWRLAQTGLKVTVVERGRVGCEASRAAAGMLSPQGESQTPGPFFDLCLRSRAMYKNFAEELSEASGIDVEYKDEGTLFVVLDNEDDPEKTRWTEWQIEAGLSVEHVTSNVLRKIEPAVTKSATRAIFLPDEHQVDNRRLMDALEVTIKRARVELVEDTEVTALLTERSRVTGVVAGSKHLKSGSVVLAAGAWSDRLLAPIGLKLNVIPARGQMIAVRGRSCPIERIIHSSGVYIVPRRDGRILIGATVEYSGFRKAVTVAAIETLLRAALNLIPSLDEFDLEETWSGLRPDTPDHLPIIGPTCIDSLFLATGHFRNGILLAPITAEMILRFINDQEAADDVRFFGIDRFDCIEPAHRDRF